MERIIHRAPMARRAFARALARVSAWMCFPLAASSVAAQVPAAEHPIAFTVSARIGDGGIPPGGRVTVVLDSRLPPGWHFYSLTTPAGGPIASTITVAPPSLVGISGTIDAPVPEIANDPNFGIVTETYADSAQFRIPVQLMPSAPAGKQTLSVLAYYQACNNRYCLPPVTDTLRLGILVAGPPIVTPNVQAAPAGPAGRAAPALATRTVPPPAAPNGATGGGSFALFIWLAATMGALSLLTPCVFPMVPITISYFSRHEGGSRGAAVRDALLYATGIVGAFTGFGLGLALAFGVTGLNRFAASPWLNLAIAALFIGFALSLFGVLHIALPAAFVNRLDRFTRAADSRGLRRAGSTMLMGSVFALTSFTCTAPFVGTLLVSASQGNWRWPAAGLLTYSSVFALPFLLLALVPQSLGKLPRSGVWLVTLKGALGFIELAAAFKFLSNADLVRGWGIFTRDAVVAAWVVLGGMLTLFLAGVRVRSARAEWRAHLHPVAATVALCITGWLATGLAGRRLGELESFLPPAGRMASGVAGANELSWILDDYDGALAQARAQHKSVLVDFTGFTCTNCRWMEANMFPRSEVRKALGGFVRVRLFTDGDGERYRAQQALEQELYHTVALPLYAIVDSLGAPRATFLGMTRDTGEFVAFLRSGS